MTFETASVAEDDDDVRAASSVKDFGVNYIMGAVKRVHSSRVISVPKAYALHRKPHRVKLPQVCPPALKLSQAWCIVALLLFLVGYSRCGWPLGSTVSVLGLLGPVVQRLGVRRSGPTSLSTGRGPTPTHQWLTLEWDKVKIDLSDSKKISRVCRVLILHKILKFVTLSLM